MGAINQFTATIQQYRGQLTSESLTDICRSLVQQIGYQDDLARRYPDPNERQSRWAAVEEVVNWLAAYEKRAAKQSTSLKRFLDEVALAEHDPDDEKSGLLERNAVVLMTLHSAKGLEFPQVYLVGMEEGILPHHRSVKAGGDAVDEERRLCYVGITRAQQRLTLSFALTRMKWGRPRPTHPSRFLYEITGQADNPQLGAGRGKPAVRVNLKQDR